MAENEKRIEATEAVDEREELSTLGRVMAGIGHFCLTALVCFAIVGAYFLGDTWRWVDNDTYSRRNTIEEIISEEWDLSTPLPNEGVCTYRETFSNRQYYKFTFESESFPFLMLLSSQKSTQFESEFLSFVENCTSAQKKIDTLMLPDLSGEYSWSYYWKTGGGRKTNTFYGGWDKSKIDELYMIYSPVENALFLACLYN